ncbi:MAG: YcjX family protein [Pseudomonadota bacterium]
MDNIARTVEGVSDGVSETFFEPVIRLGVTGLSRSGKTVFITSLVANLMDRGRMPGLKAASDNRIEAAFLQPQPNDTVPRFPFEAHLSQMTGPGPSWPEGTRSISQLRLSLRVAPSGILSALKSPRTVHLDIVDYPGEWLLDLPLMQQSFAEWSASALELARSPARVAHAADWLALIDDANPDGSLDEPQAQDLARAFTAYLSRCREAGLSACAPGRFLMPGDLEGSPALTFCPLPLGKPPRRSLGREFDRRYEAYKRSVVTPFFRDHFTRLDRQIVLVDALGAIHAGPQAIEDLRGALADILQCFKTGQNGMFSFLTGKSVEKILFAATKADHLHHKQHPALTGFMHALLRQARDKAEYSGAVTEALAIASLRTTEEEERPHEGQNLPMVKGILSETGKPALMYPGTLPEDPSHLLKPAAEGAQEWLGDDYAIMSFLPAEVDLKPGEGPPHIRIDRAAEFLLGDRLA